MSKPMPAHHREIEIPRRDVAKSYSGVRAFAGLRGTWIIVAASATPPTSVDHVKVIVAPARGPK